MINLYAENSQIYLSAQTFSGISNQSSNSSDANSSIQFNMTHYMELAQTPQVQGSVPQGYLHFRHQLQVPGQETINQGLHDLPHRHQAP